ncbi:hypothetical protein D3C81_1592620 [compost metagenome]
MMLAVTDDTWMIEPPSGIWRSSAWKYWKGPVNWIAFIVSRSSWLCSRKGFRRPQPVALTPISSPPSRFALRATRLAISACEVISQTCQGTPSSSATAASASGRRPDTRTLAPCST